MGKISPVGAGPMLPVTLMLTWNTCMNTINDPENYRKLLEPFATPEAANIALIAFYDEVRAARNKHRIPDVLVVASMNVAYDSGEGRAISRKYDGDISREESMAAYAYGAAGAERREKHNLLLAATSLK